MDYTRNVLQNHNISRAQFPELTLCQGQSICTYSVHCLCASPTLSTLLLSCVLFEALYRSRTDFKFVFHIHFGTRALLVASLAVLIVKRECLERGCTDHFSYHHLRQFAEYTSLRQGLEKSRGKIEFYSNKCRKKSIDNQIPRTFSSLLRTVCPIL